MSAVASVTPRLMTRSEAAAYCGLSPEAFSQWVGSGRVPHALPGTKRWDRVAIDRAIDRASGILPADAAAAAAPASAFDEWKAKKNGAPRAS
jgi:hypothetical protein